MALGSWFGHGATLIRYIARGGFWWARCWAWRRLLFYSIEGSTMITCFGIGTLDHTHVLWMILTRNDMTWA